MGNNEIPQELCNFILTLALVYNDFKYYMISYLMSSDCKPEGKRQRNSVWGEYTGIQLHIIRLHVGFAYELLNLIKNNERLLKGKFFSEITRILNRDARAAWKDLVNVALQRKIKGDRANLLARIRNKVTFHYDIDELFRGYKSGFFKDNDVLENACISLGNSIESSRFYFADLAIQGYLHKALNIDTKDFYSSLVKIMEEINTALYDICIKFIQRRGFAWKDPAK